MIISKILNDVHHNVDSTLGEANFIDKYGSPLTPSINFSSAYSFKTNKELTAYHNNKFNSLRYNRDSREIIYQLENYFSSIFNRKNALVLDSGMRAICVSINSFLSDIDTIFVPNEVYRKTRDYCSYLVDIGAIQNLVIYNNSKMDIETVNEKSLVILESFSNPHLIVSDFDYISKLKKNRGFKVILDSTFSGLCNSKKPLDFADIELQSITKYIGGYNDIIGGVITTNNKNIFAKCWAIRSREGGVLDSMSGYLALRSLRSYDLRWEKQCSNALKIYHYLSKKQEVDHIYFPGFQRDNQQNEYFQNFYKQSGSVISFTIHMEIERLREGLGNFCTIKIAPSFGSIDTLIEIPSIMSHFGNDDEYFNKIGLEKNLVRLSIGCDEIDLIKEDIERLLGKLN